MISWKNYHAIYRGKGHTVSGTIKVCQALRSPQLNNARDILVYLPPSYDDEQVCYPVIYMHDGQNLFDAATSFVGEWGVDECMQKLSAAGLPAIVVGICHMGVRRLDEYSVVRNAVLNTGGQGEAYLAFVRDTVKPLIDTHFRTLPDRDHTLMIGSSMGALISLRAFLLHGDSFGRIGMLSPAFWFAADAIFEAVEAAPFIPGCLYLDVGTDEMAIIPKDDRRPGITSARYLDDARRMHDLLRAKGYRSGADLLYVEDAGAVHNERAWGRRLPDAIRFLLDYAATG
ncbi:MAG: alpha/beta hydrolase [Anaerolineae bacterium]|nr:alpha/beta hydrolase [Anaerolineae bacterium]